MRLCLVISVLSDKHNDYCYIQPVLLVHTCLQATTHAQHAQLTNSISKDEGLTQCTCIEGYYKILRGEEDLPCDCKSQRFLIAYGCPYKPH